MVWNVWQSWIILILGSSSSTNFNLPLKFLSDALKFMMLSEMSFWKANWVTLCLTFSPPLLVNGGWGPTCLGGDPRFHGWGPASCSPSWLPMSPHIYGTLKEYGECFNQNIITVRDTSPLFPLQNTLHHFKHTCPSLLQLSEAVLEVLFREY